MYSYEDRMRGERSVPIDNPINRGKEQGHPKGRDAAPDAAGRRS
jgi:hypothetical protein